MRFFSQLSAKVCSQQKKFLGKGLLYRTDAIYVYTTALLSAIFRKTNLAITQTKTVYAIYRCDISLMFLVSICMYSTDDKCLVLLRKNGLVLRAQNHSVTKDCSSGISRLSQKKSTNCMREKKIRLGRIAEFVSWHRTFQGFLFCVATFYATCRFWD